VPLDSSASCHPRRGSRAGPRITRRRLHQRPGNRRGGRAWSPGRRRLSRTSRGPPTSPGPSSALSFQKSGWVSRSFMGKRPG